jgi:GntR family transcriptional regulator, trigonelline degradation regulator
MVQRLNGRINWLRSMTIASKGRATAGPKQLRKILAAICGKDGGKAALACREHLSTASGIAQALLARDGKATAKSKPMSRRILRP